MSSRVRWHPTRIGKGIQTRLLALLLGLTTVSVIVIAALGVNSILTAGQNAQRASSDALRAQAEQYLVQLTVGIAEKNDTVLERVRQDARNVAQYAASIFGQPEAFGSKAHWRASDYMFVGAEGQYVNGETDTSTVFVPNSVQVDEELIAILELTAFLDFQFVPVYENDSNTVAIYIITQQEISRLYPNINLGAIIPADFIPTEDIFYTSGMPENNPQREVVWTPVYDDPAGQGLLVTAVAPIYVNQNEFMGIIGIDVSLAELSANIEAESPIAGGYLFLINEQGRAIALPERGYQDLLGRPRESGEFGTDLSVATTAFAPVLSEMRSGATGFQSVETDSSELFVAYTPLTGTGWSLAVVVKAENMLQAAAALQDEVQTSTRALILTRTLPVGGFILVVALIVGLLLTNRLVDPIRKLAAAAQRIGSGEWETPLPPAGNDEIGILARAFESMTIQIRQMVESLGQRVTERTRGLQTAAEVSRATTSLLDPDELLRRVVDLVRERFDLYYVGLFLLDQERRFAVLHAGTGEAGQQMLAQGHRLETGGDSMIGQCVSRDEARIALDVGEEAVRFANPFLPETRSELALPLRARGRVIGAMTVQSTQETAFEEADIAVMQTMADQVAVAIDNARLFAETQAALKEAEITHRRYLRQAWAEYLPTAQKTSYETEAPGMAALGDAVLAEIRATVERRGTTVLGGDDETNVDHSALVTPIALRGEIVGALGIHDGDKMRRWSADEITLVEAIAERMALAAENLRLLDETQRRATQDRLVNEVTGRVRQSLDLDTVLQTAAREMRAALGLYDITIRIESPNGHSDRG
jgi:GAF domain-containing protein/HAMP domain-containing protein